MAQQSTPRHCSFCNQMGHNIRYCCHEDITLLSNAAKYIYLNNIRHYSYYGIVDTDKLHEKWLGKLSLSEYKVLGRIYNITIENRRNFRKNDYYNILNSYLSNNANIQIINSVIVDEPLSLIDTYRNLLNSVSMMIRNFVISRYGDQIIKDVIINSGKNLLNNSFIRESLRFELMVYDSHMTLSSLYYPTYLLGQNNINTTQRKYPEIILSEKEEEFKIMNDDECPICYNLIYQETMISTNCCHNFCNECIISQIRKSNKSCIECALCRTEITRCSVKNQELFESFTKEIKENEKKCNNIIPRILGFMA